MLGPVPEAAEGTTLGSIMKFLGNQYWIILADGQSTAAEKFGVTVDVQAAASESDQVGQLNAAETMLRAGYDALLVSPQTDTNLCPAVEKAEEAGVLVLNVNDAVLPGARQWVGPNQIQNGISAAEYVLENLPAGAKVAVIEGQAGVYAAGQRTKGFTDTATAGGLDVVASVPGDWDIQKALDAAATIIQQYPDIAGFYANNDTMALGIAEAVNAADLTGQGDGHRHRRHRSRLRGHPQPATSRPRSTPTRTSPARSRSMWLCGSSVARMFRVRSTRRRRSSPSDNVDEPPPSL